MLKRPVMEIKEGKFLDNELAIIKYNMPYMYDKILEFNRFNYFQIYRAYLFGFFRGYAVLFAGNLDENEAYLEDLYFFGDITTDWAWMIRFLKIIKNRPAFGHNVDNIYYNTNLIYADFCPMLDSLGYREKVFKR